MKLLQPDLPSPDQIYQCIKEVHASNWYSNFGPLVCRFENEAGNFFGQSAFSFSNGTLALYCLIKATATENKRYVIMPSWTFVATAHAVIQAGYEPFFIDVDYATQSVTYNELSLIDPDILSNSALIITTSSFGFPINQKDLLRFQKESGVPIIIDGAAQIYSAAKNILPTVISLHATKLLGVGEGGLVITRDHSLGERAQSYSNFGFLNGIRDSFVQGTNAKMNEYSAAVGLLQLERGKVVFQHHLLIAGSYLANSLDSAKAYFQNGWGHEWISSTAVISFDDSITKDYVVHELNSHGIPHRDWWKEGCHEQPAFSKFKHTSLDNTKQLARTTLGIPFHSSLTEEEIIKISSICFK